MSVIRTIIKNTTFLTISNLVSSIGSFFLLVFLARYLGELDFGKYGFAIAFTGIFNILAIFGIDPFIVREIARDKELLKSYITNIAYIKLITCLISFTSIFIIINLTNYPEETKYLVYLIGIYVILISYARTFRSVFQAFEKLEYEAIIMMLEKLLLFILICLFFFYKTLNLYLIGYIYVFVGLVVIIISYFITIRKISILKSKIDFSLWKKILLLSSPFVINLFFAFLFFRIDSVMLSFLKGDYSVGIYTSAYGPLLHLSIAISVFLSPIYPVMSRFYKFSKISLMVLTRYCCKYFIILAFPIVILLLFIPDKIVFLLYGNQYQNSIQVIRLLSLFIPFRFISSITGTFLTSTDNQNNRTKSIVLCSIFNIFLNILLIPKFDYIGAAFATVVSEILLYIIYFYYMKKSNIVVKFHGHFIKPFISSLVMSAVIILIINQNFQIIIFISILSYLISLFITKSITRDEIIKIIGHIKNKGDK